MRLKYEDLPLEQYKEKKAEYEARGLAIPDGALVELTDWAEQNGITARRSKGNPNAVFRKVGNARKHGRIKVEHGERDSQPYYYWAGFWQKKGTRNDNQF